MTSTTLIPAPSTPSALSAPTPDDDEGSSPSPVRAHRLTLTNDFPAWSPTFGMLVKVVALDVLAEGPVDVTITRADGRRLDGLWTSLLAGALHVTAYTGRITRVRLEDVAALTMYA